MGERQSSKGSVWSLPAGHLNAAISALDKGLSEKTNNSKKRFLGLKECPRYMDDVAQAMMDRFYVHSADACIALGYDHVFSMAQARSLWNEDIKTDGLDPYITQLMKQGYTLDDLEEAAEENEAKRGDWRCVFYTGLTIGEQLQRQLGSFVTTNIRGPIPEANITPTSQLPLGMYLVNLRPTTKLENGWLPTAQGVNDWLHNVCSGAKHKEIMPPALFTYALVSFMAEGLRPLSATEWFHTGVAADGINPIATLLVKYSQHDGNVLLAKGEPISKDRYLYYMRTPRKPKV